jgi:hypothetical protein
MTALHLLLRGVLMTMVTIFANGASAQVSSVTSGHSDGNNRREILTTPRSDESGKNAVDAQSSLAECSASLMVLLPTPEELERAGYRGGEVTGRGCRTLIDVAATLENPEQAALDLSAWGWVDTVYETLGSVRISIHRFETPEGAEQALDVFGSVAHEPASTAAVDRSRLEPNQRALQSLEWAALVEQDGVLLIQISIVCHCDAPGPLLTTPLAIMDAMQASWVSSNGSGRSHVTPLNVIIAPEKDSAMGSSCLSSGDLACAKENLEAAFASARDVGTRYALYQFHLVNGDVWQEQENLDRARRAYDAAKRLDPARSEAADRLEHLRRYSGVELFDPFTDFSSLRGCDPHEAMILPGAGTKAGTMFTSCGYPNENGRLLVTLTGPGSDTVHWSHTPTSSAYAVTAEFSFPVPQPRLDSTLRTPRRTVGSPSWSIRACKNGGLPHRIPMPQ